MWAGRSAQSDAGVDTDPRVGRPRRQSLRPSALLSPQSELPDPAWTGTALWDDEIGAEEARFELARPLRAYRFSRPAQSAALPLLRSWMTLASPGKGVNLSRVAPR